MSGRVLPKELKANLQYRVQVSRKCASDPALQQKMMEWCASSCLYWINLWAWTYNVQRVGVDGKSVPARHPHVPFITWPVQDSAVRDLQRCILDGQDAIVDKSRDMGASWLLVTVATWCWLFLPECPMLFVSRIEDLVDKPGDPDCLFWKVDYILNRIPPWMLPVPAGHRFGCADPDWYARGGRYRNHMHLLNPANGSVIDGQATTEHVGRGGRRRFVVFDEMAAIPNASAAWISAADTTTCRIGNSTPLGPGTEFTNQRNLAVMRGNPKLITLGYWDHPTKGRGRTWTEDVDGEVTGTAGRWYWATPWFHAERKRRSNLQDLAQNILIEHITAGNLFFNAAVVTRHAQRFAQTPRRYVADHDKGGFVESDTGNWFLWCDVDGAGKPVLKQTNFVIFCDIANGKGASNSAAAVLDRETGRFVAEYVDPNITPHDFATEICWAGANLWCGQLGHAFLGWEENGPGEAWYQDVLRLNYPFVYFRQAVGQRGERHSKAYGWRSDQRSKRILCLGLDRAITRDEVSIPSQSGLDELLQYVYFDDGSIGPGQLRDETTGARQAHGDRVIAYAGAVFLRGEAPRFEPEKPKFPRGSMGQIAELDKMDEDERKRRERDPFT